MKKRLAIWKVTLGIMFSWGICVISHLNELYADHFILKCCLMFSNGDFTVIKSLSGKIKKKSICLSLHLAYEMHYIKQMSANNTNWRHFKLCLYYTCEAIRHKRPGACQVSFLCKLVFLASPAHDRQSKSTSENVSGTIISNCVRRLGPFW